MLGLYGRIAIIQPMWAIDEYAKIFRVWVWLRPPQAPRKIERIAIVVVSWIFTSSWIWNKMDKGASFCHVRTNIPMDRGMPCVTSGNQEWNGANPNFIAIETVISKIVSSFVCAWIVHVLKK